MPARPPETAQIHALHAQKSTTPPDSARSERGRSLVRIRKVGGSNPPRSTRNPSSGVHGAVLPQYPPADPQVTVASRAYSAANSLSRQDWVAWLVAPRYLPQSIRLQWPLHVARSVDQAGPGAVAACRQDEIGAFAWERTGLPGSGLERLIRVGEPAAAIKQEASKNRRVPRSTIMPDD